MREHPFALLIHSQPQPFESLRRTLKELAIETYSITTCKEAQDLISQCKPHIVFTESSVADGSWTSVLNMAEAADVPLSVIVVGAVPDTRLYLSVMERGAFDFVAPPFEREPLDFVVRSAALNAQHRRETLALMASEARAIPDFITKRDDSVAASTEGRPDSCRGMIDPFVVGSPTVAGARLLGTPPAASRETFLKEQPREQAMRPSHLKGTYGN